MINQANSSTLPLASLLLTFAAVFAATKPSLAQMAMPAAAPPQATQPQTEPKVGPFPFQDSSLPISQRVDDLISRMTLDEKVLQMQTDAPAIGRLGIPQYGWWSESLHGFTGGEGTVFPEPIGLAATWDIPLESQIADTISTEDRAAYNMTGLVGNPQRFHGLTFFAPNINIFRDPRWGRGQETYGEDPYLTSRFAVAFVKGLQGDDPKYLKVVATPKHFAVHSGPEPLRHKFDAEISDYDLWDTYLPAFQAAIVEGKAQSIMGAYSALDGVPDCASPLLLQKILREKWGFDGYVVSDCGAIDDIFRNHKYAASEAEGSADAVKAGCDITCGAEYASLTDAVKQGLITEDQIDLSLKRLFTARMKLGMFDPLDSVPYNKIPASEIDSDTHRKTALNAARESIVLLKNDHSFLPLDTNKIHSIAVIGPNADSQRVLLGNYNGYSSKQVTILAGLKQRAAKDGIAVSYFQGADLTSMTVTDVLPAESLRAPDGSATGLKAEYFNGRGFQSAPATVRQDSKIDFDWSEKGPDVSGITGSSYSVRWTGQFIPPKSGLGTIGIKTLGFARLYLDDKLVATAFGGRGFGGGPPQPAQAKAYSAQLTAGKPVAIRIEYGHFSDGASLQLLWRPADDQPFADAVDAAKQTDAVVFVGGISSEIEGEEGTNGGGDRDDIDLPLVQEELLKALADAGKPVVAVLMNGSALAVNWAQKSRAVPAIVEAWYPGEEGGDAVADVLFGDYNPAGRLPVTFYAGVDQLPPFDDYSMKNRTYRYFTGKPLYGFGYGLSYSSFSYSKLTIPSGVKSGEPVTVTAEVKNTGKVEGDEVAELYLAPSQPKYFMAPLQPRPNLILAGFQRVHLAPGEAQTVSFTLNPNQLLLVDSYGGRDIQPGPWQIYVGGRQPNLTGRQPKNVAEGTLFIKVNPKTTETRVNSSGSNRTAMN